MPGQKLRWLTAGLFASAGAGMLSLTSIMNPASAFGEPLPPEPDIALVIGGSGVPIPGSGYVQAAYGLYLENGPAGIPTYPDITGFFGNTSNDPTSPGFFGQGLPTPEQLYPLFSAGVHQEYLNYPQDANGLPDGSTSVGQGASFLQNTILSDQLHGLGSTVFGYSQSSTLAGVTMRLLDPNGVDESGTTNAPNFLLIADPSNPNGGLLERFNGFETISGHTTVDPLNLPSLGLAFDGATPADDYTTSIYTLEYDGFADFPRYPLNFLSDVNAFLGIAELHGTYLDAAAGGIGPTPTDIADAVHLITSGDTTTNYYMIDTIGGPGHDVIPPLVALLPAPLQALLGPDLTYLINLGYGDGTLGYSDAPANVATPFGLFPDVSMSDIFTNLAAKTQDGITAFEAYLSDPTAMTSIVDPGTSVNFTEFLSALSTDPTATLTDLVNAISSATSTAYSTLLPTADILNALVTSVPAYDYSLFAENLATGDLADAFGLPVAADTAIGTLAAGFEYEIISNAISQITADFSGLF